MGRQIVQQLFMSPKVLGITAGVMILLGLIPGMPHLVFLSMGALLGWGAWVLDKREKARWPPKAVPRCPSSRLRKMMAKPPGTICSPWTCWAWSWATA
jgi:flagellar biosynthesis protein FlhA